MSTYKHDAEAFLNEVYRQTHGELLHDVVMWDLGSALGWERSKTKRAVERLIADGLLRAMYIGGGIAITTPGILAVEAKIPNMKRELQVDRVLRAIYDASEGSPRKHVNLVATAQSLGLSHDEARQVTMFMEGKGLVVFTATGGIGRITPQGIDLVESSSGLCDAHMPQSLLPPHNDKRLYGIVDVDVVDHSGVVKKFAGDKVEKVFQCLRSMIELEACRRFGVLVRWNGDGGMIIVGGESIEERSTEIALAIHREMEPFNERDNEFSTPIALRVAVGSGVFAMPSDFGNLHAPELNHVAHLQKSGTLPNTVSITAEVFKELPDELQRLFNPAAEPFEGKQYYQFPSVAEVDFDVMQSEEVKPSAQFEVECIPQGSKC